jgi:hypothetical protein
LAELEPLSDLPDRARQLQAASLGCQQAFVGPASARLFRLPNEHGLRDVRMRDEQEGHEQPERGPDRCRKWDPAPIALDREQQSARVDRHARSAACSAGTTSEEIVEVVIGHDVRYATCAVIRPRRGLTARRPAQQNRGTILARIECRRLEFDLRLDPG